MIVRVKKNEHYTIMSNYALKDNKLSLKAKGLWAYIMTNNNKWKFTGRSLSEELKESRPALNAALKELESEGYLKRGQIRQKDGKFQQGENILYEEPWTTNPSTEKLSTKQILKQNNNTEAEASESTKEKESIILKLFYLVIKKYKLPALNHNHVRKWAHDLEAMPDGETYLQQLLDNDLREAEGDFRPTLNTAFDIIQKKLKVQRFYNGGESEKTYDPRVFGEQ